MTDPVSLTAEEVSSTIKSVRTVFIDRSNDKHIRIDFEPDTDQLVFRYMGTGSVEHGNLPGVSVKFGIAMEEWMDIERMLDIAAPPPGDLPEMVLQALKVQREQFHEALSEFGPDNDESMEGSQVYSMLDSIWRRVG